VIKLLIAMLEKDFQTIHAFLAIHTLELKVKMLSVQQILAQVISELILTEDVLDVQISPFSLAQTDHVVNHLALEDPFLKKMELVEHVLNTQDLIK
jgi:hypothetical protein